MNNMLDPDPYWDQWRFETLLRETQFNRITLGVLAGRKSKALVCECFCASVENRIFQRSIVLLVRKGFLKMRYMASPFFHSLYCSFVDPDPLSFGCPGSGLLRMRILIQEHGNWPKFTYKPGFLPFKKAFGTLVGMTFEFRPITYFKYILKIEIQILWILSLITIRIRMDPHWFGSLDPDPYWNKPMDPDPNWNKCGSTTLFYCNLFLAFLGPERIHRPNWIRIRTLLKYQHSI
jgi:hypothetical protein